MAEETNPEKGTVAVPQLEMERKKVPYPKGVFFIMATEMSERFSYYGMRAVLTIYMRNELRFTENESTSYYHIFLMLCYGLPIFWGVLSDSWLGKYKTILFVSVLFGVGNIVLTLSSVPPLNLPTKELFFCGLLLMAIGTSGMKPCVAPLGGEQFTMPQHTSSLKTFFSLFFFMVTIGNMVSTVITPIFRRDVKCFDSDNCYPLAFGVPSGIMLFAIVIFMAGRPLYRVTKPDGNMFLKVTKCIAYAIKNRKNRKTVTGKKSHWLDAASDQYDSTLIADTKGLLRVLVYYLPIPMFFALYEQLGSRWTLQATRMDGRLGSSFSIKPDQMQVSNALLMFIFVPFFTYVLYPFLGKFGLLKRPLQKMVIGGLLAAASFSLAGIVETKINPTINYAPKDDHTILNFVNSLSCSVNIQTNPESSFVQNYTVDGNSFITLPEIEFTNGKVLVYAKADCAKRESQNLTSIFWTHELNLYQTAYQTISIAVEKDGSLSLSSFPFEDDFSKSKDGNARMRLVMVRDHVDNKIKVRAEEVSIILTPKNSKNKEKDTLIFALVDKDNILYSETEEIPEKTFTVQIQYPDRTVDLDTELELKNGGSYIFIMFQNDVSNSNQLIEVTPPNAVHILWLLPQYLLMAWGEILFIVSGMEFSFTEAPASMKSLLQALWHLMNACGNVIVIIAAQNHGVKSQALEFFIFSGLMFVDSIIFGFMAYRYKYVSSGESTVIAH